MSMKTRIAVCAALLALVLSGCEKVSTDANVVKDALTIKPAALTKSDNGIKQQDGTIVYSIGSVFVGGGVANPSKGSSHRCHFYQEKFYFTPGNTGFKVFKTSVGNVGVGICWDQWFPETARCLAINGADIILYPTAIGSEPILDVDSSGHWMRTMQGHSAANVIPVAAANRIGTEEVTPCEENGNQNSALCFYGSSFLTDETGDVISKASRDKEEIIYAEYNFEENRKMRSSWGLFRDRRPECYGDIVK